MPAADRGNARTAEARPASRLEGGEGNARPVTALESFWPASDTDEEDADELGGGSAGAPLKRKTTPGGKSKYPTAFKAVLRKFTRPFNKKYQLLPNDQRERDRNVTQHRLFLEMYGGRLQLAPVECPRRALDLGCGPGAWTSDFARRHASCEVLGIDLEPTITTEVLPNCRFVVGDFTEPWTFSKKFDFIHLRMLGGLPSLHVLESIHTNLEPGGWAEFSEWTQFLFNANHSDEGTAIEMWNHGFRLAYKQMGQSAFYPLQYSAMLRRAGFSEIYVRKHAAPINTWPTSKSLRRQGEMATESIVTLMDALAGPLLGGVLGWPGEKTEALLAQAKMDIADPGIHSFMTLVTVYARKTPDEPDGAAPAGL